MAEGLEKVGSEFGTFGIHKRRVEAEADHSLAWPLKLFRQGRPLYNCRQRSLKNRKNLKRENISEKPLCDRI